MEKIMDVTEEITEGIVEPVAEIAEGIDWAKGGLIAGGVALVVAGAYGVYKLAPKIADGVKTKMADRAERKKANKEKGIIKIEDYEVNDVDNDK